MGDRRSSFWFPVKTYGWGWGLPVRWQGWLVIAAYVLHEHVGIRYFREQRTSPVLLIYLIQLTVLLALIVVAKGERPAGWRREHRRPENVPPSPLLATPCAH